MLQRIQSLYLLLIAIFLFVIFFLPLGVFTSGDLVFEYRAFTIRQLSGVTDLHNLPVWALGAILCISIFIALFTIFAFRNRKVQIRLCILNALLLIGFYIVYTAFTLIAKSYYDAGYTFSFALVIPLICIILDYLAIRAIGSDEVLIRSLNHLR